VFGYWPMEVKFEATRDTNKALEADSQGLNISDIVPLDHRARFPELVEHPRKPKRVVFSIGE